MDKNRHKKSRRCDLPTLVALASLIPTIERTVRDIVHLLLNDFDV